MWIGGGTHEINIAFRFIELLFVCCCGLLSCSFCFVQNAYRMRSVWFILSFPVTPRQKWTIKFRFDTPRLHKVKSKGKQIQIGGDRERGTDQIQKRKKTNKNMLPPRGKDE